jgi:hypothetical protein
LDNLRKRVVIQVQNVIELMPAVPDHIFLLKAALAAQNLFWKLSLMDQVPILALR